MDATPYHPGPYHANAGPLNGLARPGDVPGSIGVLLGPDAAPMPKGVAYGTTSTPDHRGRLVTVWRIELGKQAVPGPWVYVGRRFMPLAQWEEREAIRGEG